MSEILRMITDIVDSAPAEMEFLDWLFGDKKQSVLNGTPIVLYGAGNLGKDMLMALQNHGIFPKCFCNSDTSKSGHVYCQLPVISIEELKKSSQNSIVLITTQTYAASIKKLLIDSGFPKARIIWPNDFDMLISLFFSYSNQSVLNFMRARDKITLLNVLKENEQKISAVYKSLADQKSRDLFITKLAFLVCNDNLGLFRQFMLEFSEPRSEFGLIPYQDSGPENYFYFNNDVFSLTPDEIFVDVGAYDGDSVISFIQACKNQNVEYKHIYAFEPDPQNHQALLRNTTDIRNISFHKVGVWSESAVLRFESSEKAFSTTASGIAESGDIKIDLVSLDEFLGGDKVTLIKMDPPGDVISKALDGARKTITKYRPKLVLNAYNTMEDIFEVPLLVNRLWPEYKLYLRHVSWTVSETDLFAVA